METSPTSQAQPESSTFVDHAAEGAHSAIRSTQNVANAAFDRLNQKVESARDHATPLLNRISSQARETTAQLREKAHRAQDTTVTYIKEEPAKAMLIAAATGAALMGLIMLAARMSNRRD